jgi:hypothetical protein
MCLCVCLCVRMTDGHDFSKESPCYFSLCHDVHDNVKINVVSEVELAQGSERLGFVSNMS